MTDEQLYYLYRDFVINHIGSLEQYFAQSVQLLSEIGYVGAGEWNSTGYDKRTGFVHVNMTRTTTGGTLHWIILDFDAAPSWDDIMQQFLPGFNLTNGDHGETSDWDVLKRKVQNIVLVPKRMNSIDYAKHFFSNDTDGRYCNALCESSVSSFESWGHPKRSVTA